MHADGPRQTTRLRSYATLSRPYYHIDTFPYILITAAPSPVTNQNAPTRPHYPQVSFYTHTNSMLFPHTLTRFGRTWCYTYFCGYTKLLVLYTLFVLFM